MNFRQIDLVLDLSRTLNFRITAENMYISQPALTHQIKTLEEELGVRLFQRSSRGVSLTPAGAIFCRNMQHIRAKTQETVNAVRNCGDRFTDALVVGLNAIGMPGVFSTLLRRFTERFPGVLVDFHRAQGEARLNAFLQHELDVVFYIDEALPALPGLERRELFRSRLYCVMPREHPLANREIVRAQDLSGESVLFNDGHGPQALIRAQNHLLQTVAPRVQLCQNADAALLWIGAGGGVALMPSFCCDDSGRFAWVPYDWEETIPCSVAWFEDHKRSYIAAFAEIAKQAYEERRASGGVL